MSSFFQRACRPLAIALAAVATLGACVDDPKAPTAPPARPNADVVANAVLTVTTTSAGYDPGTLPWAIAYAKSGDVIRFDPSLAGDTISLDWTMETNAALTIEGPATKGITISGRNAGRVFRLRNDVMFRNVTITQGYDTLGSAILSDGHVRMENSTVTNNHGGGAALRATQVTLVNSTVSGNTGTRIAAGIAFEYTLSLFNSTVAYNSPGAGIGTYANGWAPIVVLNNSIVSNNAVNCRDALGFQYQGMNLSNDYSCGNTAGIVVLDPRLKGLADNGGPTQTVGLDHRSAAVNGGESCSVTVDQRYVARDAYCDVGAFEFTDFTAVTITIDPIADVRRTDGSAVVTGTVACSREEAIGVLIELEQQRGGKTPYLVKGTGGSGVACTTAPTPWSAVVASPDAAFGIGGAKATARTNDTPVWVRPSSTSRSVKLIWAQK